MKQLMMDMLRWLPLVAGVMLVLAMLSACEIHSTDVVRQEQDSTVYIGQLRQGQRDGLGTLLMGDSVLYSGQWRKGLRQGSGWLTDSTGHRIDGTWDHDTLVSGTRRDSLGVYVGEFNQHYQAHGYGHLKDTLDTYFEGQWKNGERRGFGFSSQKSKFRVGEWRDDRYLGERLNYNADRIYGIDLSKYQHIKGRHRYGIDWGSLRITHLGTLSKKNVSGNINYKVSFIFIKSTEGTSVYNPYYRQDYAAARKHGYPVGTYHFFSHRSKGGEQAMYFLRNSHFQKGDLPPVLDLEPLPSQIKKMGGPRLMWLRVRNWLQIVEKHTGQRPILYISQTFINRGYLDYAPDIKKMYPVWIARYGEYKPDVRLWVWQLAPDGRVRGIHGAVDINVFNGYEGEFKQWLSRVSRQ